ncbi:hypothetical protein TCAL_12621, partial [Tigriopus californicus]
AIKQEILSKQSADPRSISPSPPSSISSSPVGLVTNALQKLARPVEQIQLTPRSASPSPSSTLSSRGSSSQPHTLSALNESSNSLEDSQSGHSSLQSGGSEGGTMSSRIQRFHGPPSIQLGTWDDRSRKMSEMPIPTFGSAKTGRSGRHSLASLSTTSSELSSLKSTSPHLSHLEEDEADFSQMNQQVRASIQRMEQNHQNKPPKFDAKARVAKPWKRASLSQMTIDPSEPKNEVLASARKPSGILLPVVSPVESPNESTINEEKPRHFYFGQEPSATDNRLSQSKPTAIEKVKNNEALSHPQNIVVNPGYQLKEYVNPMEKSGKPNFAFGDTPPSKPSKNSQNLQLSNGIPKPVLPPKTKDATDINEPSKEVVIEPKIKPAVVNYSKFADFRVPRPQLEPKPKRPSQPEKTQDEVRKAFESELKAGKKSLKSYENDSDSGSNSVSPGPNVSIIPPPPPPQFSNGHHIPPAPKMNGPIVPPAPKLTNFPSNVTANGKRIVPAPSKQQSSHADLLVAIRNKGGLKGLRKTGKQL